MYVRIVSGSSGEYVSQAMFIQVPIQLRTGGPAACLSLPGSFIANLKLPWDSISCCSTAYNCNTYIGVFTVFLRIIIHKNLTHTCQ